MTPHPRKPYWIDDYQEKHEAYDYDDSHVRSMSVAHQGRALSLIVPEYVPLTKVRVTASDSDGDLLFLVGERRDEEGVDGSVIEGGDGVVMVARKHHERDDVYWLLVWHALYPETLSFISERPLASDITTPRGGS